MEQDIPPDLDELLRRAAEGPQTDLSVDTLWRRSSRRRRAKIGASATAAACAVGLGIFALTDLGGSPSAGPGSAVSSSHSVVQNPNSAVCSPAAAEARVRSLIDEINRGDMSAVEDSISTPSRVEFFQLPGFQQPTAPAALPAAIASYFHTLYAAGGRFAFVSLTAGPIDSSGNRGFSFQLKYSAGGAQAKPAAGTGAVDCYEGKVAALYGAW